MTVLFTAKFVGKFLHCNNILVFTPTDKSFLLYIDTVHRQISLLTLLFHLFQILTIIPLPSCRPGLSQTVMSTFPFLTTYDVTSVVQAFLILLPSSASDEEAPRIPLIRVDFPEPVFPVTRNFKLLGTFVCCLHL